MRLLVTLAAALCATCVSARSIAGDRVLVLLDSVTADKQTFSKFFADLESSSYTLSYYEPKSDVDLFTLGERAYDHAVFLTTKSKGLGPKLTPQILADFVEAGGNILVGASSTTATPLKAFARELDIDVAERDSIMVDHFNYDTKTDVDGQHTSILAKRFSANPSVLSKEVINGPPVLFRGVGHVLGHSPMLVPILTSASTAYSYDTQEEKDAAEDPWVAGVQAFLVSGLQARNNARVVVAGSVELFSDAAFDASTSAGKTGNRAFARDVAQWCFQERGVIRATDLRHSLANQSASDILPTTYRVKNDVAFGISLSQWSGSAWTPYLADDVQLELIMLDPYIRKTFDRPTGKDVTAESARYETVLTLPDHYGVFHFKVNYKRPGLSYIEERSQVTIRHYRHDEYPRFLTAAYPYYTGTAVTCLGFLVFSFLWLYGAEPKHQASKTKKQQ
ncbi:oligosaccharyl transferase glycoprotein complex, beta subunit [Savitreella phatthalungensis]